MTTPLKHTREVMNRTTLASNIPCIQCHNKLCVSYKIPSIEKEEKALNRSFTLLIDKPESLIKKTWCCRTKRLIRVRECADNSSVTIISPKRDHLMRS